MDTKITLMGKIFLIPTILLLSFSSCDSSKKNRTVSFSYRSIMYQEFRSSEGRVIPVTVGQAIETGGDISRNGEYFFYVSNQDNGNFDIYMREMENVHTARITSHASRETAPAISPDGKQLAFVSNREDPEGDIYILKIKAGKIIKSARKKEQTRGLDHNAKNLTQYQDTVSKTVMTIKDDGPAWSPDGKHLAFSSKRGGIENIWLMEPDGSELRQITREGGVQPRFSNDGSSLIFISYRDQNSQGEVYTINLKSGKEKRITRDNNIKLFPSFHATQDKISYTSIEKDSNKDGTINLRDNSLLRFLNTRTKISYPLTRPTASSFQSRWLANYKTRLYGGIILYSDQTGENINLNIIPEYGIIPMKKNADHQLKHALRYVSEFNDNEKYMMALKSVYYFHGRKKDLYSRISTARALRQLFLENMKRGRTRETKKALQYLETISGKGSSYSTAQLDFCRKTGKGHNGIVILQKALSRALKNKTSSSIIPYLMEDIADSYAFTRRKGPALAMYEKLKKQYPQYKRIIYVHLKHALLATDYLKNGISDSILYIYKKGLSSQKVLINKHLISVFRQGAPSARGRNLTRLLNDNTGNKSVQNILNYSIASADKEAGHYRRASERARTALVHIKKTDVMYFYYNSLLGEIARKEKQFDKTEKFLFEASSRYLLIWKEQMVRKHITWLVNYYEEYGERAILDNRNQKATKLYNRYALLMTYLHQKRRFEDIYNRYGARAHVLYIDTVMKQENRKTLSSLARAYSSRLPKARMDFDKAHIYALGYLHFLQTFDQYNKSRRRTDSNIFLKKMMEGLKNSINQLEWATFIDDTFVDPYILKSWIYQYVDLLRRNNGSSVGSLTAKYFPPYLFEKNLPLLQRAIEANDEKRFPGHEAKIHLNMGNNFFNLANYSDALSHYNKAEKFRIDFNSKIAEAVFYFHRGYCLWQTGKTQKSQKEMEKVNLIYQSLSSGKHRKEYRHQIITLYKYFALFNRMKNKHDKALTWYAKIISDSKKLKVKIDRPRYLQEMAWCFHSMGNDTQAVMYLKQANRLLKKKSDAHRTYKMRWKFAGIPFKAWDLEENIIIGDTKIFQPLETREKKLLNLAMYEDIHERNNNYVKAGSYLKEKLKYYKQRGYASDHLAIVTTWNNLGYYTFKCGKLKEAEKLFKKAWNKAKADSDNINLEGTFVAVMNLANLYAYSLETGHEIQENPLKTINELINEITSFRNNYEEKTYEQRRKTEIQKAKAKNTTVSLEKLSGIKQEIIQQANEIYFKLDIALGVLLYYKTELRHLAWKKPEGTDDQKAFELYSGQREIFKGYKRSLSRFTKAINTIKSPSQAPLKVKLLLNQGTCFTHIQALDRAYGSLLDAESLAEKYQLKSLLFQAYLKLGIFLQDYGRDVEGEDAHLTSMEYMEKARSIVAKNFIYYADRRNEIASLYNRYSAFLLAAGKTRKAYQIEREGQLISRNLQIHIFSPEFSNKQDKKIYREYIRAALNAGRESQKRSHLLINGAAHDDEKIVKITASITRKHTNLKKTQNEIQKNSKKIWRYISTVPEKTRLLPYTTLLSFKEINGKLSAFYLEGKNIRNEFISKNFSENNPAAINNFLAKVPQKRNLYITINNTFIKILKKNGIKIPPFTGIIDPSDIQSVSQENRIDFSTLYHTGSGLKSLLEPLNLKVEESSEALFPLQSYSIVVNSTEDQRFSPGSLFSLPIRSTMMLQSLPELDGNKLKLYYEASRYAGIKTIIFTTAVDTKILSEIIKISSQKTFDFSSTAAREKNPVIPAGMRGLSSEERKKFSSLKTESYYKSFVNNVKSKDYLDAAVNLESWKNSVQDISEDELSRYFLDNAFLLLLQNKGGRALEFLRKISESKQFAGKINQKTIHLFSAYLQAEAGNIESLEKILQSVTEETGEIKILNYIAAVAAGKNSIKIPLELQSINTASESILGGRLRFLAARYLYLAGNSPAALKLLKKGTATLVLNSSEENLLGFLQLKTSTSIPEFSKNSDSGTSLNIFNNKHASKIMEKFDNPERHIFPQGIHWSLSSIYSLEAARFLLKYNRFARASEYLAGVQSSSQGNSVAALNTILLHLDSICKLSQKKYPEAHASASEAEKNISRSHRAYLENQMVLMDCESHADSTDIAESRLHKLITGKKIPYQKQFHLQLLSSFIELKKIAGQNSASAPDGRKFEKAYFNALAAADRNPRARHSQRVSNLFTTIADAHIAYKIGTGKKTEALISAELKKHMRLRLKIQPKNENRVNAESLMQLNRQDKLRGGKFRSLLQKNPSLLLSVNIPFIDVKEVQAKLSQKDLLLYLIKNRDNIYCWVLSKKAQRFIVLPGAWPRINRLNSSYKTSLSKLQNTYIFSKALEKEFAPLKQYLKSSSRIFLITDEYLEDIPFEITGSRQLLEESHRIAYITSLNAALLSLPSSFKSFYHSVKKENQIHELLEQTAIEESGITFSKKSIPGSFLHYFSSIYFDVYTGTLKSREGPFLNIQSGTPGIYVPQNIKTGISSSDLALFASQKGVSFFIINNSAIHDINNALFVSNFYTFLRKGLPPIEAFHQAKRIIMKKRNLRHPSYWQGLRIYCNGI